MAKYRGKHSRPASDSSSDNEQQIPRSSLQRERDTQTNISQVDSQQSASTGGVPGRRASHTGNDAAPADGDRRGKRSRRGEDANHTGNIRRVRSRQAAPDAFKHHDALRETTERKHLSRLQMTLIIVPIVLLLVGGLVAAGIALSSLGEEKQEIEPGIAVTVIIPDGATTDEIANILMKAQVIDNTQNFVAEVKKVNAEQSLKPGTYDLETMMDTSMLIDILLAGPIEDGTRLTIAEGLTVEQTAAAVEAATGIAQADFLARAYAASEYVAEYPFLADVYNNSLEGYLYPKTYAVPKGATADDVVRILLDQFVIETSKLDLSYAESSGMNLFHIVTLASLIERETAVPEERPLVSSVIYNRLRIGMKLQIDATVVYALGSSYDGNGVLLEHLEIDSPYNTYLVNELPAGPICSPSIESIEAAAHPAETNYYYYVLTSEDGSHTFCETEDEFYAAKEEYERVFGIE